MFKSCFEAKSIDLYEIWLTIQAVYMSLFQLNWNFKTTAQLTAQRDKSYFLKGSVKAIIYQKSMSLVLISDHLVNKICITDK